MARLRTFARKKLRLALIRVEEKVKRMIRESNKQQNKWKARVASWK